MAYEAEYDIISIQGTNNRAEAQAVLDEKSAREPPRDWDETTQGKHNFQVHPCLGKEDWPAAVNETLVVTERTDNGLTERFEFVIRDWDLAALYQKGGRIKVVVTPL